MNVVLRKEMLDGLAQTKDQSPGCSCDSPKPLRRSRRLGQRQARCRVCSNVIMNRLTITAKDRQRQANNKMEETRRTMVSPVQMRSQACHQSSEISSRSNPTAPNWASYLNCPRNSRNQSRITAMSHKRTIINPGKPMSSRIFSEIKNKGLISHPAATQYGRI